IMKAMLAYETASDRDLQQSYSHPVNSAGVSIVAIRFRASGSYVTTTTHGQSLDIEIEVHSTDFVSQARVVVGLFHAERGPLFHISSYLDNNWIELNPGRNVINLSLSELPLQFGLYYVEAS